MFLSFYSPISVALTILASVRSNESRDGRKEDEWLDDRERERVLDEVRKEKSAGVVSECECVTERMCVCVVWVCE